MGVFARYTEEARRVVFFARYEAGLRDAPTISTTHLAAGLYRECRIPIAAGINLREQLKDHFETLRLPPTVNTIDVRRDIPLDNDAKKALAYAVCEADSDGSKRIDAEHLLRALLCFDNAATEALRSAGFSLEAIREASNADGRKGRFLRRFRWQTIMFLRDSVLPALLKLAILFIVGLLAVLVLRWLGAG